MSSLGRQVASTSRKYAHKIKRFCEPLKRHLDIDLFWMYKIDHAGGFSTITSAGDDLFEHFWDEGLYKKHPHLRDAKFYPTGYHLASSSVNKDYQSTQGLVTERYLVDQLFMALRQSEEDLTGYCFATIGARRDMTGVFINNLDGINQFIKHFDNQFSAIQREASDFSVNLAELGEKFDVNPHIEKEMFATSREEKFLFALDLDSERADVIRSLTPRERACLAWFLQGCSASETAKKLFLSPRTVEHYLENVKDRCGIAKRSELFAYLADWREFISA